MKIITIIKGDEVSISVKRKETLTMEMIDKYVESAQRTIDGLLEDYGRQTMYEAWDMKEVPVEGL